MKTDLTAPCSDCPFRKDSTEGWLGRARATEIVEAVLEQDQTFSCHKTNSWCDETGDTIETKDSQLCAGAAAMNHHQGNPNFIFRLAAMVRRDTGKELKNTDIVFRHKKEFIEHHGH